MKKRTTLGVMSVVCVTPALGQIVYTQGAGQVTTFGDPGGEALVTSQVETASMISVTGYADVIAEPASQSDDYPFAAMTYVLRFQVEEDTEVLMDAFVRTRDEYSQASVRINPIFDHSVGNGAVPPDPFVSDTLFIRAGLTYTLRAEVVSQTDWGGGNPLGGLLSEFSFTITVVPAPGAVAITGLAGVVAARRRRP